MSKDNNKRPNYRICAASVPDKFDFSVNYQPFVYELKDNSADNINIILAILEAAENHGYQKQEKCIEQLRKEVKELKAKIINMGILRNELTNCMLGALGELYKRGVDATPAQESILKRIVGEAGEDLEGR